MDFTKALIEEYEVVEAKKRKKKARRKPKITYTTGSIGLNMDFFNKELNQDKINDFLMGGNPDNSSSAEAGDSSASEGGAMGESLNEDKDLLFPDSLTRLIDKYDIEIEWRGYGKTKDQRKYFVKLPVPDKRRLKVWNEVCDLNPVDTSLIKSGISFILDSQSILENSVKENKDNETLNEVMTPLEKMQALGGRESVGDASRVMGESLLKEAKRYVRRYYIRPQNIFCSNKADIIKALIDIGDQNCSVYTLNNLGDEKDVAKLMTSDIIYYYDNGILYDKNHVKVMDYDLYIKHEENRPKVADVDKISDDKFQDMYDDRITDSTGFDESVENKTKYILTESKAKTCCICGEEIEGHGNNAEPYEEGTCCDACNLKFVIPARLYHSSEEKE